MVWKVYYFKVNITFLNSCTNCTEMCLLGLLILFRFILENMYEYLVYRQVRLASKRFALFLKVGGQVPHFSWPFQTVYDERITDKECLRVLLLLVHIIITVGATIAEFLGLFRFEGLKHFLTLFYQTSLTFSSLRYHDDKLLRLNFHGISIWNLFLLAVSHTNRFSKPLKSLLHHLCIQVTCFDQHWSWRMPTSGMWRMCEPTFRRNVLPPSSGQKNPRARNQLEQVPAVCRRYVPPKRRFTQDLHGATSQKTTFFIVWTDKWLICFPKFHVSFKVCIQLWTAFCSFHISIRRRCNRINEVDSNGLRRWCITLRNTKF
jgi:hypothetical protein